MLNFKLFLFLFLFLFVQLCFVHASIAQSPNIVYVNGTNNHFEGFQGDVPFARTYVLQNTGGTYTGNIFFRNTTIGSGTTILSIIATSTAGTISTITPSPSGTNTAQFVLANFPSNGLITITESLEITGCTDNNTTSINILWGCNDPTSSGCQPIRDISGNTVKLTPDVLRPKLPLLEVSITADPADVCYGSAISRNVTATFTNKSSAAAGGSIKNLVLDFLNAAQNNGLTQIDITSITIGAGMTYATPLYTFRDNTINPLSNCVNAANNLLTMKLALTSSLASNQSFTISWVETKCCPSFGEFANEEQIFEGWKFHCNYKDECGNNQAELVAIAGGYSFNMGQYFPPVSSMHGGDTKNLSIENRSFDISSPANFYWNPITMTLDVELYFEKGLTQDAGTFGTGLPNNSYQGNIVMKSNADATSWIASSVVPITTGLNNFREGWIAHFDVSAMPAFTSLENLTSFLRNSKLFFDVHAYCPANEPHSVVEERFFLNQSQSSCTYECRLPLSKVSTFIDVMCPGCAFPGMIVQDYIMNRITIGDEDSDDDGIPNTGPNKPDTKRAMVGDVIATQLISYFNGGGDNATSASGQEYASYSTLQQRPNLGTNFLQYCYLQTQIEYGNEMEVVDNTIKVSIVRNGLTVANISLPNTVLTHNAEIFWFDLSLPVLKVNGLNSAFQFEEGDKIMVDANYRIIAELNIPSPRVKTISVNNLIFLSGEPHSIGVTGPDINGVQLISGLTKANAYWCEAWSVPFTFVADNRNVFIGFNNQIEDTPGNYNPCLKQINVTAVVHPGNESNNVFPNEVRRLDYAGEFNICFPKGYSVDFTNTVVRFVIPRGVGSSRNYNCEFALQNIASYAVIDANAGPHFSRLTLKLPSALPFSAAASCGSSNSFLLGDEYSNIAVFLRLKSNSCSDVTDKYFTSSFMYDNSGALLLPEQKIPLPSVTFRNVPEVQDNSLTMDFNQINQNDLPAPFTTPRIILDLAAVNGQTEFLQNNTVSKTISLRNQSGFMAHNVFLNPTSIDGLTIISIDDLGSSASAAPPLHTYTLADFPNGIFQIGNIQNNTLRFFRINATYNCNIPGSSSTPHLNLNYGMDCKDMSEGISSTPCYVATKSFDYVLRASGLTDALTSDTYTLCANVNHKLLITSDEIGEIHGITAEVKLPIGLTFFGNCSLIYTVGTIVTTIPLTTPTTSTWNLDVSAIIMQALNLQSFSINSNHKIEIYFSVNVGCIYNNAVVNAYVKAYNVCNAILSKTAALVPPTLQDAQFFDAIQFERIDCSPTSSTITYKIISPLNTQNQNSLFFTLPQEVIYLSANPSAVYNSSNKTVQMVPILPVGASLPYTGTFIVNYKSSVCNQSQVSIAGTLNRVANFTCNSQACTRNKTESKTCNFSIITPSCDTKNVSDCAKRVFAALNNIYTYAANTCYTGAGAALSKLNSINVISGKEGAINVPYYQTIAMPLECNFRSTGDGFNNLQAPVAADFSGSPETALYTKRIYALNVGSLWFHPSAFFIDWSGPGTSFSNLGTCFPSDKFTVGSVNESFRFCFFVLQGSATYDQAYNAPEGSGLARVFNKSEIKSIDQPAFDQSTCTGIYPSDYNWRMRNLKVKLVLTNSTVVVAYIKPLQGSDLEYGYGFMKWKNDLAGQCTSTCDLFVSAGSDKSLCVNIPTTLNAVSVNGTGTVQYVWSSNGQAIGSGTSINVFPSVTTTYTVTNTDSKGCTSSDDVTVFVNAWSNLNTGVSGIVRSLYVYSSALYVGGGFTKVDGKYPNNGKTWNGVMAQWNGTSWNTVIQQNAYGTEVNCFAVYTSKLYASGNVQTKNGLGLINMNGTQWNSNSTVGKPHGLAVYNNNLFFVKSGTGNGGKGLGRYNVTSGYTYPTSGPIIGGNAIIVYKNELYVQGMDFKVYKFNGLMWSVVGTAFNETIEKFYISSNNNLYAAGNFTGGIAKLSNGLWSLLGTGISGTSAYVQDMVEFNAELYVGGSFSGAGSVNSPNLIKWNGTSWVATAGTDGPVNALVVYGGKLIVGGSFSHIGLAPINNIGQYCIAAGNIVSPLKSSFEKAEESILLNYPNPFMDETELMVNGNEREYSQVRIMNLNGEILEEFLTINNRSIKYGQKLPEGIFIVEVVNSTGKQTAKIIKMK